ncbi:MAG: ubiquitin-like domain-containing protein [Chloroflexi bacterium]|nr:ubiquitin-like domain-containing protein [Chloroflexota bacterium]MCL5951974.1 ubiquitin-like domain-containing protein [Chloroflexota bacterium]
MPDAITSRVPHKIRLRLDAHAAFLSLTLVALSAMGWGYLSTLRPITLLINNQPLIVFSNQTTVAGVLNDASISLASDDVVFPASDAPIPQNQPISVHLAYPVQIEADGDTITRRTQSQTVGEVLSEAGVVLKQGDRILVDGRLVEPTSSLARPESAGLFQEPPALSLTVQRAVPIQIDDNGSLTTFYTTAPTLGEALRQAGLVVYLGDYVTPDLGNPVMPGWQVYIRRSRLATIEADGKTIRTRTLNNTIAGLLAQEGIQLNGKDYTLPAATNQVSDGMTVQVVRVKEDVITESETIPFQTVWQADPTLEIDGRKTVQVGSEGVKKRQIRIVYEDGREIKRSLDKEWIDKAPVNRLIAYGTKIVSHPITLADGTNTTYWRKIRILATSYTASTSGKAQSNPLFGMTYLGWHAGTGIVAVDPRVIGLRSKLYIPGYGMALAGDTGGRIKGRRVDLGFDEENLVLWYKWLDIYVLDPPPPYDQINFVLPDLPSDAGN